VRQLEPGKLILVVLGSKEATNIEKREQIKFT